MKENMWSGVFFLLVIISCCSASHLARKTLYGINCYRSIFRQRSVKRPITTPANPGTTPTIMTLSEDDDRQASKKGIRLPSDKCVISWDQFKLFIDGRDLVDLYGINNDDKFIPGQYFKLSSLWTVTNDTVVRRRGSVWNTAVNRCVFLDGLFKRIRIDDSLAIFQGPRGESQLIYFVSSNPEKYIIITVCFESLNTQDGRCPSTLTHFMVKDQRDNPVNKAGIREGPIRLNDIPWTEMEEDAKYCFGQMFVDDTPPQMYWAWKNQACPVPGTEAFEQGVASMRSG